MQFAMPAELLTEPNYWQTNVLSLMIHMQVLKGIYSRQNFLGNYFSDGMIGIFRIIYSTSKNKEKCHGQSPASVPPHFY